MIANLITLVIFTSEGREHLLRQTIPSFKKACSYNFHETILSVDGRYDMDAAAIATPGHLLVHPQRTGYVKSIISALKLIDTPYFFLLEDDFIFNKPVQMAEMLNALQDNSNLAGVFLSRTAPLTMSEKQHHHYGEFYRPGHGLSVSPTLFRTDLMRDAFAALVNHPKDENTAYLGFEPFIDSYFIENGFDYALLDPGDTAHVNHIGYMESTAREYHMINSVDPDKSDVNKRYLSGLVKELNVSPYNKIAMLPKLWLAVLVLSFKLLKHRRAYDTAFRIYISYLKNFKY